MSKVFHILFVILAIIFIITTIIDLVAIMQSDINLTVEESTLPHCIEDSNDLIHKLTMGYYWKILLWITLGAWHVLQAFDD